MTTFSFTRTATMGVADHISEAFRFAETAMKSRRLEAKTFKELNALSTRELDDLGLNRSDLHRVAKEAAQNF